MRMRDFLLRACLLAILGFMLSGATNAQLTAPPSDNKDTASKPLGSIDLSNEIEGMSGRQLRARLITIQPGGHTAAHSHDGRPTLEYVVQGDVVEIRNGVEVMHHAGDMVASTHEVSHWWENRGTVPVLLLPVDVFKP